MVASETDAAYICMNADTLSKSPHYTHLEIHPSLLFGIMGNQIIFPEHNPAARNTYFCGQSRQAISLYHSNYQSRIDKMGVVLNYGQKPLIRSKFLDYINHNENPYGVNTIVAIMTYGGYNVEDAIMFNRSAVDRGLFNITYYNSYEAYEGNTDDVVNTDVSTQFENIANLKVECKGIKSGYDYNLLDEQGIIKENVEVDEKTIIIGKVMNNIHEPDSVIDQSMGTKKGQTGMVDKTYITENKQGHRLAKVRVRAERKPSIGDKFVSRCAQKGTVGIILNEEDMPFTADGIRPDIIINPHALPTRMTIGQLLETLYGKACTSLGFNGDCTAYNHKDNMEIHLGTILTKLGYHSSGTDILYNGFTGECLTSNIFIGPTFYMRLKQMVKDKINYRARGPVSNMTRQTVQGRANDGGLRIGEMERDGLLANGMSAFISDSLVHRGDEYHMAVCNHSGVIAIYNEQKQLFFSPMVDGPIQYVEDVTGEKKVEIISKYGKQFSIVRVPYAFKLLLQELATMNIQMRLITSDNIEQLTSLQYSNNIQKLLHTKSELPEMISHIISGTPLPDSVPSITTKQYNTPDLPPVPKESSTSPYAPVSPNIDDSPPFVAGSPASASPPFVACLLYTSPSPRD